jgi:DNA transformation protein
MDLEFIRDLFSQFRPVTTKRLFGGAGLWSEGLMFGLVFDGAIFLKVDETSIPDFEREGSRPFVYTRAKSPGRVGRHSLSYWRLPERLYDDPDELAVWAARAGRSGTQEIRSTQAGETKAVKTRAVVASVE